MALLLGFLCLTHHLQLLARLDQSFPPPAISPSLQNAQFQDRLLDSAGDYHSIFSLDYHRQCLPLHTYKCFLVPRSQQMHQPVCIFLLQCWYEHRHRSCHNYTTDAGSQESEPSKTPEVLPYGSFCGGRVRLYRIHDPREDACRNRKLE